MPQEKPSLEQACKDAQLSTVTLAALAGIHYMTARRALDKKGKLQEETKKKIVELLNSYQSSKAYKIGDIEWGEA